MISHRKIFHKSGKIIIATTSTREARSEDSEDVLQSVLNILFLCVYLFFFLIYYFVISKKEFRSSSISLYSSLTKERTGNSNIMSTSLALFLTSYSC